MDLIWFAGFLCQGGLCANQITGFLSACGSRKRRIQSLLTGSQKDDVCRCCTWPASLFLTEVLLNHPELVSGQNCLEVCYLSFFCSVCMLLCFFLVGNQCCSNRLFEMSSFLEGFLIPAVSFLSLLLCLSITWNGTEISFATFEWGIPMFVKFILVHFIVTPYIFLIVLWTWLQLGAGAGMVGVCLARLAAAKVHLHLQQFSFLFLLMIIYL